MFKQFLAELSIVLGLALITFAGYSIPHWILLSPDVQSDAVPLRCMLFLNEYLPFILAFACFCTGAFLPFIPKYTARKQLVCMFLAIGLIAFFAASVADSWQYRLSNARQRLSLLEQQSLQYRSAESMVHRTSNALLVSTPAWVNPGLRTPLLPILAAVVGDELYVGGKLSVTNWSLEGSVHPESDVRLQIQPLPAGIPAAKDSPDDGPAAAAFSIPLGESIEDLIPEPLGTFFTLDIDRKATRFLQWPIVHPKGGDIPAVEGMFFLFGLAVFACGCGLLLNKRGASLIQSLEDIFLFGLAVAVPIMLLHVWWIPYSAAGDTAEEPLRVSTLLAFARPALLFVIGIPTFMIGLRRRRRSESSTER